MGGSTVSEPPRPRVRSSITDQTSAHWLGSDSFLGDLLPSGDVGVYLETRIQLPPDHFEAPGEFRSVASGPYFEDEHPTQWRALLAAGWSPTASTQSVVTDSSVINTLFAALSLVIGVRGAVVSITFDPVNVATQRSGEGDVIGSYNASPTTVPESMPVRVVPDDARPLPIVRNEDLQAALDTTPGLLLPGAGSGLTGFKMLPGRNISANADLTFTLPSLADGLVAIRAGPDQFVVARPRPHATLSRKESFPISRRLPTGGKGKKLRTHSATIEFFCNHSNSTEASLTSTVICCPTEVDFATKDRSTLGPGVTDLVSIPMPFYATPSDNLWTYANRVATRARLERRVTDRGVHTEWTILDNLVRPGIPITEVLTTVPPALFNFSCDSGYQVVAWDASRDSSGVLSSREMLALSSVSHFLGYIKDPAHSTSAARPLYYTAFIHPHVSVSINEKKRAPVLFGVQIPMFASYYQRDVALSSLAPDADALSAADIPPLLFKLRARRAYFISFDDEHLSDRNKFLGQFRNWNVSANGALFT